MRSFGVVATAGLGAGVVAAIAGNNAWAEVADKDGVSAVALSLRDASAPPVTAFALVTLAAWGVLLVTRGRVRRGMAWFALLSALATLGFAVAAWIAAPTLLEDDLRSTDVDIVHTAWSYGGVAAAVIAVAAGAMAVRSVRSWPEMGQRYDSPVGAVTDVDPSERDHLDLWKDLDQGHDPTA